MNATPTARRSILAIWHWPRWVWGGIVGVGILYPFTAVPAVYVLRCRGTSLPTLTNVVNCVYAPVVYAHDNVKLMSDFNDLQFDILESRFGPMPIFPDSEDE
jgi:hypothetical protein